jgi:ATP-dependent Clp protease ATP-binding subunit ClpC
MFVSNVLDPTNGDRLEVLRRSGYGVYNQPADNTENPSPALVQLEEVRKKIRAINRVLIQGLAMSSDEQYFASGDMNGSLDIFEIKTGVQTGNFNPHQSAIWGLRFSPDNKSILATYHDGTVLILDARTGEIKVRCREYDSVSAFDWSPDGSMFAVAARSAEGRVRDARTGEELLRFAPKGCRHLCWAPNGGYIATGETDEYAALLKFWDVQSLLPKQSVATDEETNDRSSLSESHRKLTVGLSQLHRLHIYPPLSLLSDLMELTAGRSVSGPLSQLITDPASKVPDMMALQWPAPARLGLVAILLHNQPSVAWAPPSGCTPALLVESLTAALGGDPIDPTSPPPPIALLHEAEKQITDQLITLLSLLGPDAVAADPGLPLRLLPRLPDLPVLSKPQRRLLGLRVRTGSRRGRSVGNDPGADRAQVGGVESGPRSDWKALLPSQLALPPAVLTYRHLRGELLFRVRDVAEPPRFRPVVLLLDVSPPTFGSVETVTRLAAFIAGRTLQQAGVEAMLVTTGGPRGEGELVRELRQPADLVEVWMQRSLRVVHARRSLRLAAAVRDGMRGDGTQEPLVLLLTQPWFGAEEEVESSIGGMRGLFVQYPSPTPQVRPALAGLCERWASVRSDVTAATLGERLGYLLG